ncbi:MAG: hypothetical protein U1E45_01690 [Geminicoccaceae bacterium]
MAKKKSEKGGKPVQEVKAERWTVRGVPAGLQKAAGDVARARGQTLGQWLSELLTSAVARGRRQPATAAASWEEAIERRLGALEGAVFGDRIAEAEPKGGAAAADKPGKRAAA